MIESLLDLTLICNDWRNVARLTLASQRGTRRHLQMAMGQDGTMDEEFKKSIRDLLRDTSRNIEELEEQGVKQLQIEDKFRLAKDYRELRFWYCRFVGHAHNNFEALFSRHVKTIEIVLGNTLSDSETIELLSIGSSVSAQVLTFLPRFTNTTDDEAAARFTSVQGALTQLASGTTTTPSNPG